HYGVPSHKIFSVPHCVDNEWFAARAEGARPQRSAIRREWGVFENDIAALFVGKFIAKKRPLDLLEALTKRRETGNRRMIAVFVGGGELENELRKVAAREELRVQFAGFKNQSELPACYVAADVLVLPSD